MEQANMGISVPFYSWLPTFTASSGLYMPLMANSCPQATFWHHQEMPRNEQMRIEVERAVEGKVLLELEEKPAERQQQQKEQKRREERPGNMGNVVEDTVDRIGESARNRFGRPYISGRPLLLCDRKKIVRLYREGCRKIAIAREIGVTHSCVSKVIRRYEETGELENKNSRTASCACPGEAENHDLRICRHVRFNRLRAEQQLEKVVHQQHQQKHPVGDEPRKQERVSTRKQTKCPSVEVPKKFSIDWILASDNRNRNGMGANASKLIP